MAHNALPICDPPSGCRRPGRRRQVRAKAARPEQQELLLCGVLVVSIGPKSDLHVFSKIYLPHPGIFELLRCQVNLGKSTSHLTQSVEVTRAARFTTEISLHGEHNSSSDRDTQFSGKSGDNLGDRGIVCRKMINELHNFLSNR